MFFILLIGLPIVRLIFSEGGNVTLAFSEGLFSNCSRTVLPIEDHEDTFTCLTYDIITSSRGKFDSFFYTHVNSPHNHVDFCRFLNLQTYMYLFQTWCTHETRNKTEGLVPPLFRGIIIKLFLFWRSIQWFSFPISTVFTDSKGEVNILLRV